MKKRIQFIINPISGVGKKNILPTLIDNHLDHSKFEYDIIYTEFRGHAKEIAQQAIEDKYHIVAIVGGDGSVSEVGTTLINSDLSLAIIPAGSGNGIARHLGLSLRLKNAIKNINQFKTDKIDVVSVNGAHFIGVAGIGFDALIAHRFDNYHSRGLLGYIQLVLKEFRSYKGVKITLNEEKTFDNLLFCCIANGSQFGNGFKISPQSIIEDGKFEIVLVQFPSVLGFIRLLFQSLMGTVHKSKLVHIIPVQRAQIDIKSNYMHLDGDPIDVPGTSLVFNCNEKKLSVIL